MTIALLSDSLVAVAIGIYAAAFVAYSADLARVRVGPRAEVRVAAGAGGADPARDGPVRRTAVAARQLLALGCLANLAAVVARGLAAERAPWGNMYEFAVVGAAAIATTFVVALRRYPIHILGIGAAGLALVCLGLAVTVLYTPAGELVPVLDSYWLVIHVAAAILSGGVFTIAALASGLYLIRQRGEGGDASADTLGRVSYGLIVFAFPIWTFAVIAGAIWAEAAWGRYWGWDPKETWAFITWVCYAAYLHAESTVGWRGKRAAWFSLLGYAAFLFNFVGVNIWIPGLHSYAGL